jgi:opacity protein-like surface antigen
MRRHQLLALLLVSASPALAQRVVPPAIDRGSLVIGGGASISRTSNSISTDGQGEVDGVDVTAVSINPSLLYFVRPGLAIGGEAGFGYSDFGESSSTSFTVGPALRAYFARGETRTLPYVGVSLQLGRVSFDDEADVDDSPGVTVFGVEGTAGITWLLSRQVGILGEAFVNRRQQSAENALGRDVDQTATGFGVRFGVAAFLPRVR